MEPFFIEIFIDDIDSPVIKDNTDSDEEYDEGGEEEYDEDEETDSECTDSESYVSVEELSDKITETDTETDDSDDSELDDILSESDQIMIKQNFDCDCLHVKRVPRYFRIKGFGNSLTNRYVIKELIKQRLSLECNHIFLAGFIKNTDCQFELITGS